MTLKYESEILFDLMKRDGDDTPSDVLPYESELKEKYLQQVEGAYPKLQDYRPEWLNYNLVAHLPADFPVETLSNVTSATVDNVVPYAYKSAILKGQTLVNSILNQSKHSCVIKGNSSNGGNYGLRQSDVLFSKNTKYTFFYTVESCTTNNDIVIVANSVTSVSRTVTLDKTLGRHCVSFTTKNEELTHDYSFYFHSTGDSTIDETNQIVLKDLVIVEGDYTNQNIPYFEGMQSATMPVLTTTNSLNLFTKNNTVDDGTIDVFGDFVEAKKNDKFSFNEKDGYATWTSLAIYNVNKERIYYKYGDSSIIPKSIVLPDDDRIAYVRPRVANDRIDTIMFNRGEVIPYEEYKLNILTVNEDIELRGIEDVQDSLNCLTGELTQRIGEIVLDGSENWAVETNENWSSCRFKLDKTFTTEKYTTDKIITNGKYIGGYVSSGVNTIRISNNTIYIFDTTFATVNEFKNYLQQNPLTIQYPLSTESIKTVNLSIVNQDGESVSKLRPFEGTMHMETDGQPLKPLLSAEVPVEAITQNLASFINEE